MFRWQSNWLLVVRGSNLLHSLLLLGALARVSCSHFGSHLGSLLFGSVPKAPPPPNTSSCVKKEKGSHGTLVAVALHVLCTIGSTNNNSGAHCCGTAPTWLFVVLCLPIVLVHELGNHHHRDQDLNRHSRKPIKNENP